MWKRTTAVTVVVLVIALAAGFFGCEQESPVAVKEHTVENIDSSDYPKGPVNTIMDLGAVNYPINPWLPLNTSNSFGHYVPNRGIHLGDDCVRSPGTPIYAIRQGMVKYARYNSGGWGYLMIVESMVNNLPFCTVYGHLGNAMFPGEGNWVSTNQYIGTVGSMQESGQTTPHLHLGIHLGWYGAPTGTYPSWCRGYSTSTSGWSNPTTFMAYW